MTRSIQQTLSKEILFVGVNLGSKVPEVVASGLHLIAPNERNGHIEMVSAVRKLRQQAHYVEEYNWVNGRHL